MAMFRDKFWLSLLLTIPVLIWSPDIEEWFGYTAPTFPGSEYLPAILGTIVFLYGGLVFVRGAQRELADRQPGMMTLISMAIVVAFVISWIGTLGLLEVEVWWELSTLIVIMLLGHWLEMRSIAQAQGALQGARGAAPRHRRARHRRRDRGGPARRPGAWTTSCSSGPAPACPSTASSSMARPMSTSR